MLPFPYVCLLIASNLGKGIKNQFQLRTGSVHQHHISLSLVIAFIDARGCDVDGMKKADHSEGTAAFGLSIARAHTHTHTHTHKHTHTHL